MHGLHNIVAARIFKGFRQGRLECVFLLLRRHRCFDMEYAIDKVLMNFCRIFGIEQRIVDVGLNALHLDVAEVDEYLIKHMNEVVLRIAIRTKEKKDAQLIIPEISPLQLNGPPGASFFGGRAHVTDVIGLWPTLIPRDAVKRESHIIIKQYNKKQSVPNINSRNTLLFKTSVPRKGGGHFLDFCPRKCTHPPNTKKWRFTLTI